MHIPVVEEAFEWQTWAGVGGASRTAVLDKRRVDAVTVRRLVPAFRLSQIKLEGEGSHDHQHQ